MHSNTSGRLFSFTSFGESHGPVVGCVVDGCPSLVPLSEADIQPFLDRRRPGTGDWVSPRREKDEARILSGVHEGVATGHPILILVENRDARSGDYEALRRIFRPGHADVAYQAKYGVRDHRGGGRASARETVVRVAAGAVASAVLAHEPSTANVAIKAGVVSLGGVEADPGRWDDARIDANPFFCPDAGVVDAMGDAVRRAIRDKNSLGGIVEIRVRNVPTGLGEPVYDRLDARIGQMCLGLNAVKGVEIGDGFAAARSDGNTMNDAMRRPETGRPGDAFLTNHAGGILGGVSTGAEIVVRCAFKPTPSIGVRQSTVDNDLNNADIELGGRHDPAVCIRAVPVLEATMALILADFLLIAKARNWSLEEKV